MSACSVAKIAAPHTNYNEAVHAAAVQYPIEGGKTFDELASKMEALITEAKIANSDLIVFPELITLDTWPLSSQQTDSEIAKKIAIEITPRLFEKATYWSRVFGSAILVGSSPRLVNGAIRNTALLAFPDGEIILQDKLFLTAWEKKMGWQAGERIEAFTAPWGRSAILTCYDIEFPGISQALVKVKPHVLLVPSMTESESGLQRVRWSAQARAVEHHAFVIVSGTVGKPTPTWIHHGQSVIISPRDATFPASSIEGEKDKSSIVFGTLDITKLRESRKKSTFYPAKDQTAREGGAPKVHLLPLAIPKL